MCGYTQVVKVAVSLPDELYSQADEAATRVGLNRSQFYARALAELIRNLGEDPVTSRLDELAEASGAIEPGTAGPVAARRLIDAGTWEW